jgi:hypothetical protein
LRRPENGTASSQSWNIRFGCQDVSHSHHRRYEQITLQDSLWHASCITNCINHKTLMNTQFESTYALLVRSQEKGRGVLEAVLYIAFILSAVLLIWEFAQSPIKIRAAGFEPWAVEETAKTQATPQS